MARSPRHVLLGAQRFHGDSDARPQAHVEYAAAIPEWLLDGSDVTLEAGAKQRAVLALRRELDGTDVEAR